MRNSFVMYTAYKDQINMLTREQRGDLLTAVLSYARGEELPQMDGITAMAFSFIRSDMDRDADKYEKTCEARRQAGAMGGRPKANGFSEKAKKANGFFENQTKAKKPDNDNDNENDNDLKNIMSGKPAAEYPYKAIIQYLNDKTGKSFQDKSKDTRKHIKARIDEGFTENDFYKVIDNTVKRWKGDAKMCDYLRPATLFGTKFESYLNMVDVPVRNPKQVNFPQRNYDMKALEKALLRG